MSHSLKLCTVKELKTVYGIPYSRQHIWRLQDDGKFPLRVILGQCRVAFRCAEIEIWLPDPLRWSQRAVERISLGDRVGASDSIPRLFPSFNEPSYCEHYEAE